MTASVSKIATKPVTIGGATATGREEATPSKPGEQRVHPVGVRILVRDLTFGDKTSGGVIIPDVAHDAHEHLNYIGLVMELGADCYRKGGPSRYPSDEPWCKPGDWVMFGKYAGQKVKCKSTGEIFRYINDGDVLGVTEAPNDFKVYLD